MSYPVNIEKSLEDWTFDELCKWAAWEVAQGLLKGEPLRSVMFCVLQTARQWNPKKGT